MARYRVDSDPGVQIAGVGFFKRDQEFSASENYVPSKDLIPLDAEAHAALAKARKAFVDERKRKLSELEPPKKMSAAEEKELLFVKPIPREEPVEQHVDDGMTVKQTAEKHGPATQGHAPKRAADR